MSVGNAVTAVRTVTDTGWSGRVSRLAITAARRLKSIIVLVLAAFSFDSHHRVHGFIFLIWS